MKLFQIEEPDGGPADASGPGAAVGIDAGGSQAEVAFSVGGNALILADREGFERDLPVPGVTAAQAQWRELFEAARLRAERVLSRPVTHIVVALAESTGAALADRLSGAAAEAGLELLRLVATAELPAGSSPALAAAILAEDLSPRPD